jgi:hypothetical protein
MTKTKIKVMQVSAFVLKRKIFLEIKRNFLVCHEKHCLVVIELVVFANTTISMVEAGKGVGNFLNIFTIYVINYELRTLNDVFTDIIRCVLFFSLIL